MAQRSERESSDGEGMADAGALLVADRGKQHLEDD